MFLLPFSLNLTESEIPKDNNEVAMLKKIIFSISIVVSIFFLSCSHDTITGIKETIKTEEIVLNKDVLYLAIGQESEISARILPDSAEKSTLSWNVYNPHVASVENGKIKGLSCGKTQVVVTSNSASKEANVIVRNLEKNRFRIHFRTEENTPESYEEYGMVLMGSALPGYDGEGYAYRINDTVYDFRNFLQFQDRDSFGMYAEISVQDDKSLMAGILKNSKGFDRFSDMSLLHKVDLLSYNEIWFTEGVNTMFLSKPVEGLTGLKIAGEDRIVTAGRKVDLQLNVTSSTNSLSHVSWQTSNQFIAEVDSNGTVTGITPGTAVISALSGGLVAWKAVCVVPPVKDACVRIHYRRYLGDYEKWIVENADNSYSFKNFDAYGAYVDIPTAPELKFSLKTEFEVALNYSGSTIDKGELWILQGKSEVMNARPVMDVGALKIVNSWSDKSYQNGGNWEHVIDGFFYMSYDALKKNNSYAYYLAPKEAYQPRMIAVFNIEGNLRGDFRISFGVGDTAAPTKIKNFLGYPYLSYGKEYSSEFPSTDIAFDISEFLPLSNDNIFMEIKDGAYNRTLKLNRFSIEVYDDYSSGPVQTIDYSGLPVFTVDGNVNWFIIKNITVSEKGALAKRNSTKPFEITSRPLSITDLEGYTPCPARMPVDQFQKLVNSGKIRILDKVILENSSLAKTMAVNKIDNSKSPHFPPVGSQEYKGSCTAWAIGYYMASYNIARKNNWDLSGARWVNGSISEGYRDKIMSPDFLYNMINEGIDNGSYGYIASYVLEDIGIASMNTAPVSYNNESIWPTEQAFREAPLNRHDESSFFYCSIKTDEDLENIKKLLRAGELVTITFQASGIKLSENDTYTQQYAGITLDHMVTVVGFDDNWTTESRE